MGGRVLPRGGMHFQAASPSVLSNLWGMENGILKARCVRSTPRCQPDRPAANVVGDASLCRHAAGARRGFTRGCMDAGAPAEVRIIDTVECRLGEQAAHAEWANRRRVAIRRPILPHPPPVRPRHAASRPASGIPSPNVLLMGECGRHNSYMRPCRTAGNLVCESLGRTPCVSDLPRVDVDTRPLFEHLQHAPLQEDGEVKADGASGLQRRGVLAQGRQDHRQVAARLQRARPGPHQRRAGGEGASR